MRRFTRAGIIAAGVLLLLLPLLLRAWQGHPLLMGGEGYGRVRIAELIAGQGVPEFDPAMPVRPYHANAFDMLLALFVELFGAEAAAIILPFLLGIATLISLSALVRALKLPSGVAFGAQLVFVLSPLFVDVFSQATPRALELFLITFLFLALAQSAAARSQGGRWGWSALAVPAAALFATFGMVQAIAAVALPFLVRSVMRRTPALSQLAGLAAFIVLIMVALPAFLQAESPEFGRSMPVVQAVSDFSGAGGLSLFAWLLGFIGLILLWKFKRHYYATAIGTAAALVIGLALPGGIILGHVLVAYLAGYALAFLASMKWTIEDMRALTLLVLVCGLLFSTLSHAVSLAKGAPHADIMDASKALASFPKGYVVLAYPDDGFWVSYWSGQEVWLDGWAAQTPDVNQRWQTAQAIWRSQDIVRARQLLHRNGIGALVITKDMRSGKVWDVPEQDLLFLLRNNETFKNVHRSSSVDIWAVKRP